MKISSIREIALSFAGFATTFTAAATDYATVITEDTDWGNLYWTPSGTPGSEDSVKISSSGGAYSVLMDGTEVSVYDFRLDNTSGSQPKLVMSNGAVLQIINSTNNTTSSFYAADLDISNSTIIAGSGTLGDSSTYASDKVLGFWFSSINAINTTFYGGISSWHGTNDTINVKDSKVYAKGVSLFEFHGNGGTTATFDNTDLIASKSDSGSWGYALYDLSHSATSEKKSIFNLQNSSQFIAGETSEYGVISGGKSFMGANAVNDAYVEVNILDGSKFVGGSLVVANTTGAATGNYLFNVSGTNAEKVSSVWLADVYITLSSYQNALQTDSFLAQIAIGDFADVRMSALSIGKSYNADNIGTHGTASVTVGSNSDLSIINSIGNTQNLNIGSLGMLNGGTSQLLVNGNSSSVKSWYILMGNAQSVGGKNIFRVENNSSDVSKRNEIWNYAVSLANSTNAASKMENYAYIGGNTYLRGGRVLEGGDNSLNFFVAHGSSNLSSGTAAGKSVLEFDSSKGLIEFDYLFKILVGNSESTGGTGELIVRGSNFKRQTYDYLYLSNNLGIYGGVGSSKENPVGGILTMAADASGFTKISADRIFMTGLLVIDFSDLRGTYEDGISFDLLEYRNGSEDAEGSREAWLTLCEAIAGGDYSQVNVITRDESDEFWFEMNGSTLTVTYYSSVPEPATFAAIFGALALGFAAYRKRR